MYRVGISPAVDRDLEKLKSRILIQDFERLRNAVKNLAKNPRPQGVRKIRGVEKAY